MKLVIYRDGREMGKMEVKCGIRQGCTGSPQLFVMVISMIIEKFVKSGCGYESDMMRVPVLFYADDGLLFARDKKEAEKMIEMVERYGREYGLKINKGKSACMMFNVDEGERESDLGDIDVVEKMKYLGVELSDQRDCFAGNRKKKIDLAERMANVTYSGGG